MNRKTAINELNDENIKQILQNLNARHLTDHEFDNYLDGKLNPLSQHRMELHLKNCHQCREKMDVLKIVDQEGPGEFDPVFAERIIRRSRFVPVQHLQVGKKTTALQGVFFPYRTIALSMMGKGNRGWIDIKFSGDDQTVGVYREDSQRNLIYRIASTSAVPVSVQLQTQQWIEEYQLEKDTEKNEWYVEFVIPVEKRKAFQSDDGLQISIIYHEE